MNHPVPWSYDPDDPCAIYDANGMKVCQFDNSVPGQPALGVVQLIVESVNILQAHFYRGFIHVDHHAILERMHRLARQAESGHVSPSSEHTSESSGSWRPKDGEYFDG